MYKHAYILSTNASLSDFLSKRLNEACEISASSLPTGKISHDGRILIMVENQHFADSTFEHVLKTLKRKFQTADVVVVGEADDHLNQQFILSGAIDFLNSRMLTSPALTRYLQMRVKRDWWRQV